MSATSEEQLRMFLDTAYHLQRGEAFPEIHQQNLEKLAQKFPQFEEALRDQLYRFVITLDESAKIITKRITSGELTTEDAISELSVTYKYFSPEVLRFALDWSSQ